MQATLAPETAEFTSGIGLGPIPFKYNPILAYSGLQIFDAYLVDRHREACQLIPFMVKVKVDTPLQIDSVVDTFATIQNDGWLVQSDMDSLCAYVRGKGLLQPRKGYVIMNVLPVKYRLFNRYLPAGHSTMLVFDLKRREILYIDPANMGTVSKSDGTFERLVQHNAKTLDLLRREMFARSDFTEFTVVHDMTEATLNTQLYMETRRPPDDHEGYCVPLTYYIVDAIITFWDRLRSDRPQVPALVVMQAFLPHYLCQPRPASFADMRNEYLSYSRDLIHSMRVDYDDARIRASAATGQYAYENYSNRRRTEVQTDFDRDCLRTSLPWDMFAAFMEDAQGRFLNEQCELQGIIKPPGVHRWVDQLYEHTKRSITPAFLLRYDLKRPIMFKEHIKVLRRMYADAIEKCGQ